MSPLETESRSVETFDPRSSEVRVPVWIPMVWLLQSDKTGDNAQLMAVAEALPWACQIKRIVVREPFRLGKPKIAASLHHIDEAQSDPLQPPWPDLVITIGRRMSMVALWIREQSGGRTKIVLLGPPKGMGQRFDLAVISEQYRRPRHANLLCIRYPLQRIDETAIAAEAEAWREEFAPLPRPLIAVMVGGLTKAVRFDADVALRLARDLAQLEAREGGSLIVTTSRRTPPDVTRGLKNHLPSGAILFDWPSSGERNPYRALLGLADRFVVTSDSLSMLMEVARLGRPLAIYQLPSGIAQEIVRPLGAIADRLGLGHHRDLSAIPRQLVRDGFAVWFGEPFGPEGRRPRDELPEVVRRIVSLFEERDSIGRAVQPHLREAT